MKLLEIISKRLTLSFIGVSSAVCFAFVMYYIIAIGNVSGGMGVLDFEFGYSKELVEHYLTSYGASGIRLYLNMLFVDLLNPLLYTLFMMGVMYACLRNTKYTKLAFVPILAGTLDYLENIFLYQMAVSYPVLNETIISISNTISLVKMSTLTGVVLCLVFSIICWLIDKKRAKV